jgi:flavin reductase (DIM6/NTAB) family NADH-FMN oxidoreductase RutF
VQDDVQSIDQAQFRTVLGHYPTGVVIVTAEGEDGPAGLSIGSFSSLSLDPPLILFCPGKSSSSWPKIEQVGRFCVNILADDQEDVSRIFASKGADKFATVGWKPSPVTKSPILNGVLAWIDCDVERIEDGGDHHIVIGRVRALEVERERHPLVFFRGGYLTYEP